jgi:hypothetical protein
MSRGTKQRIGLILCFVSCRTASVGLHM